MKHAAMIGEPRPFRLAVGEPTLEDLARRLAATRPCSYPLSDAELGIDPNRLQSLLEYWRDGFDWRQAEQRLNRFEHVCVLVDGLDIHAVRARGHGPAPFPVIIGHGWPSSFAEILPAVDLLTRPGDFGDDAADAFDVIVPSLPGYAFSGAPVKLVDATAARIAQRFHGLMAALGYDRYGASGGDIGARVMAWLGAQEPQSIVGLHLSCNAISPPAPTATVPEEAEWLRHEQRWWDARGAYAHVQRTTPRTLSLALSDSPIGLAAWMIDKWDEWADAGGNAIARFGMDDLLTQVMLYWTTGCIGTSFLTYTALDVPPGPRPPAGTVTMPAGFYLSEAEPHGVPPRSLAERQFDVARWTLMPRGGHFLPTEEPELFAADLRAFFRPLRRA